MIFFKRHFFENELQKSHLNQGCCCLNEVPLYNRSSAGVVVSILASWSEIAGLNSDCTLSLFNFISIEIEVINYQNSHGFKPHHSLSDKQYVGKSSLCIISTCSRSLCLGIAGKVAMILWKLLILYYSTCNIFRLGLS